MIIIYGYDHKSLTTENNHDDHVDHDDDLTSLASLSALLAFCSPSAAITWEHCHSPFHSCVCTLSTGSSNPLFVATEPDVYNNKVTKYFLKVPTYYSGR